MKKIGIAAAGLLLIFCKMVCKIERPSIRNPDGIEHYGCGNPKETARLLALAASVTTAKVKMKAPSDKGNLKIQIQSKNLDLLPEQISESILLTPEKGIYKISDANSVLFQKEDFDFSGPIIDGIIIRKEGKIESGKCYTFDGIQGRIIEENCLLFN